MTRKELISELSRCASLYGYPLKTGITYRINTELGTPPEIWVEPPNLVKREGRSEGTKEYSIILRLINIPEENNSSDALLNQMEESLSSMVRVMCEHPEIVKIGSMEYTTEENTLTNRGEISVKTAFTIQTRF